MKDKAKKLTKVTLRKKVKRERERKRKREREREQEFKEIKGKTHDPETQGEIVVPRKKERKKERKKQNV